ncbi:GTPase HflX [Rhizobium leguminosarum]|jgi:GTP-binding protein HflX|uniref:GTPase HflX n=3 Tax=Rhizobium TaxID=379 RepID=A0A1B8RHT1_RHILT|nr:MULTISPECIES: GTPase HflX [Rhizobium]MDH6662271.1 GTP-binding protein HflX [Rhizobium sophorae]AOO88725.1 GTP-binding protein HflX [Rhizobium leguminosarum bv. trifolii]ASS57477.1 GTPase HflX [Rhizobium leguminosarum bv. viciae]AVC49730.1 GTP-binding protein HflX [Rhizobium leguminosarum bv. viciae]MBA8831357.1 GTP-binding protein HflX [Rhizobium leguminosarum]
MRATVVVPVLKSRSRGGQSESASTRTPESRLEEATGLAQAIDLDVVNGQIVPVNDPRPATLLGTGKIEEIKALLDERDSGLVIVDHPLTPVQQRNLEKEWNAKVIDRTGLILEIFGRRASTKEGTLQVDLAHLNYQKGRLVRSWTHLERQRGGGGFMGGPGETQIEADRRMLQDRIIKLERELEQVVRTRQLHRAKRRKVPHPIVALVGYTNAGKSTLFNRITGAGVLAEDMLFATLDPTLRRMKLPHGRTVILSDTVGFISDLPTHLVAAFRATLEEVLEADLILHVRDMSDADNQAQSSDVMRILNDLGIDEAEAEKRLIEVWNKIDRLEPEVHDAMVQKSAGASNVVAVSAVSGEGVDTLMEEISRRLSGVMTVATIRLPVDKLALLPWLYDHAIVDGREDNEDGTITLDLRLSETEATELERRIGNGPKSSKEDWER